MGHTSWEKTGITHSRSAYTPGVDIVGGGGGPPPTPPPMTITFTIYPFD